MPEFKIKIDTPCHQDWDQMAGVSGGRFCTNCAKTVVDFTLMTDTQALNYLLARKRENVCGQFFSDQLDRVIPQPAKVLKKKFWPWNYLLACLLLFTKLNIKAQQTVSKDMVEATQPPRYFVRGDTSLMIRPADSIPKNCSNEAVVKSQRSQAGAKTGSGARVSLGGVNAVETGDGPIYIIDGIICKNTSDINTEEVESLIVLQGPQAAAIYGQQAMNGAIIINTKKHQKPGVMPAKKNEPASLLKINNHGTSNPFELYPNPVLRGHAVAVQLKEIEAGNYTVVISNGTGQVILKTAFSIKDKSAPQIIKTGNNWPPGMYRLQLTDEKSGIKGSRNFIVQ